MFDKAIIDTDRFMDMPMSAKALYFLLGMEADDEGFVSYKKVLRIHGGNEDDVKILTAKEFLIRFNSGVVVITDWNANNYLDKNRIRETEYRNEKQQLLLTPSKKYAFNNGSTSIEECSIEEKRIEEIAPVGTREFSLKEEIRKMEDNPRRDINIVALYFDERKPDIQTYQQFQVALKRHLRIAKDLVPFTNNQIVDAIPKAKRITEGWTLETLTKILCK
jgi:hypothetical protein